MGTNSEDAPEQITLTPRGSIEWQRDRMHVKSYWVEGSPTLPSKIMVPASELLNVSAYTPGDFHQFFDDPRTRAQYLKWAPLLLEAEEYKAGNRELGKNGDDTVEDSGDGE